MKNLVGIQETSVFITGATERKIVILQKRGKTTKASRSSWLESIAYLNEIATLVHTSFFLMLLVENQRMAIKAHGVNTSDILLNCSWGQIFHLVGYYNLCFIFL